MHSVSALDLEALFPGLRNGEYAITSPEDLRHIMRRRVDGALSARP